MNTASLTSGFFCRVMLLASLVFALPVPAVQEMVVSHLNGGDQYWWEAEAFDEIDVNIFVLGDDPASSAPDLPGASGEQYMVHNAANPPSAVEGKDFMTYVINLNQGGTYYVWSRASWGRTAGSRDHNSFYIQVNGSPAIAQFARHVNTLGDATFPAVFEEASPWAWIGDSRQPEALQGQAGGGMANGLAMSFQAGENTFIVYHREGAAANNTMCTDVFMISTVDFMPTDDDHAGASVLPVAAAGKLAITWAEVRNTGK